MNAQPNPQPILIVKRDGSKETLDINKLHKVVERACEGISGVSVSEIEIKSQITFFNGMKSSDVQETLIKAAMELISEETPNYQYVAGNLINYTIRKEVYGQYEPISVYDHVKKVVAEGFYTSELLEWYTKEDFDKMDAFIDHTRDEEYTYAGMSQFRSKYLVKNRVNGKIYETPQMAFILIAATLFHTYDDKDRMKWVREYYDAISKHVLSLATPVIAKVRTPRKQFSSCTVISVADSLKSITSAVSAVVEYVAQNAGIGLDVGRIRGIGSPIRNGDSYSTGIVPFMKLLYSATASCNQGGIRKGSTTVHFPIWHYEIEDLIVLKNEKGTEENRIRHMDYSVQISKLFYERLIKNEDITLFSPSDVPGLYDAFFRSNDEFKDLYEKYEADKSIRRKTIKASELFSNLMTERKETSRIYIMNVDNVNDHGAYDPNVAPITSSNLCQEITLPTVPMYDRNESIALCTLSAINWGKINDPDDFKKPCELAVRALDALLSYQDYPVDAAKRNVEQYRPLGIGILNFAYWMAKNDLTYEGSQKTYDMVDEYTEAWSYYLLRASVDLAKEKGPCGLVANTKYSKGILPIDTYKRTVDTLTSRKTSMDWDTLREDMKKYGIRNSVLMALMPAETSALVSNSTNGIEPPRAYVSHKQSKDGIIPQVVPSFPRLKNKYQLLWNLKSPEGYLNICAILQKYIDQSISTNTSYNPVNYKDSKIPMSEMLKHLLLSYKLGIKTLYYNNTPDGAGDEDDQDKLLTKKDNSDNVVKLDMKTDDGCDSGACAI